MAYTPLVVNDLLTWASIRALVEPCVNTTLNTTVGAPGTATITPGSMAYIYNGAQLLVGSGATLEVVTVASVTSTTFQATFTFAHASTDALYGAVFSTGQPNNILFTQVEMIGYLADALADFMLKVRPIYNIAATVCLPGVQAYNDPADAIRIERISRIDYGMLGTAIPSPGTYTVTPQSMNGIVNGAVVLTGITGGNFESVVASGVTGTTFQATFANTHAATDPMYPAGITRLLDLSVSDLDNLNPNWQGQTGVPTRYYEDELNVGQYGLYKQPSNQYGMNLWYSRRLTTLTLASPLLIPDPTAYIPYYGMLARVFRKDGEMRDPAREQYCQRRYDVGVEIVTRLLEGLQANIEPGPVEA